MKLAQPVELNDKVQLTCLPSTKMKQQTLDTSAIVVGWGALQESGDTSESLQNVRITIYDPNMCINSTVDIETDWDSQICAG